MVIEFQNINLGNDDNQIEEEIIPDPTFEQVESLDSYAKFNIYPLESGYALTIGNALRRVLYNSLEGVAVTWARIEGVLHEYATVPDVKEEVAEILLNVKNVRLRSEVDRPGKLRLEVSGAGKVCAGDLMASSDFEVVNPELHIATLDSEKSKLSMELNVARGSGYAIAGDSEGLPIGTLPIDAVFSPIRKVNYNVEPIRVGKNTNYEKLIFEVWTDNTLTPVEAVKKAANLLIGKLFLFTAVDNNGEVISDSTSAKIPHELYNVPVEKLELSSRTLNCLKRAGLDKVANIFELQKNELLAIRNFGEKSYNELFDNLRKFEMLPAELDPNNGINAGSDDNIILDDEEVNSNET
ncbi:MAG: DNA-directed RNA polymerase subunit alpha [Chloroflexi bacterium]|nr:DNA-directed RNA polymerase subunit alpha [Chloroflexota bacterium]|tara:strand:- start:335 stop:1393 length:1059 start_codon:yes stop_codon:yes gene_type:complete